MQLWLTFEELGEMLNCDPERARDHVYVNQWERRRGSDGTTRVLLPPDSARAFIREYAAKQSDQPSERMEAPEITHVRCQAPQRKRQERAPKAGKPPRRTTTLLKPHEIPLPWITYRPIGAPLAAAWA